jgi:predicted DCC family thiol-disulfide oxidoreductase YuxK
MTSPALSYRDDPDVPAFPDDKPLIVFDGVCVLCSASARFVLSHDEAGRFRLTAAQSPLGQALYRHLGLSPTDYDTFLLVEDGHVWFKSDAALRVAGRLGLPWSLAGLLGIVPRAARDAAYDLVARNRYRVFGRRETCFLPTADHAERFL